MPLSRRRRVFVILLAIVLALGIGGFLARDALFFTFVYTGSRADWELMQLRRQVANGDAPKSDESVRERCVEIANANPGSRAEVSACLFVAMQWPETAGADLAYDKLLQAAKNVGVDDWSRSLNDTCPDGRLNGGWERWRRLFTLLIERVRQNSDHPLAAGLLCKAAVATFPDTDAESAPPELHEIAELIRENYATSPDLANFCEVVGNLGESVSWSQPFEPHVRHILDVNQDRFVRCSAHFALASIVRSGGFERQTEARRLYEEFLERFDGETDYHAKGIEQHYRQATQRVLETIRLHGLGAPALTTVGVDLEGRPMSLADYHGKVVLLSFWATWCGPCMKAIPHEKELLERFDSEQFAIVGVNGDRKPTVAIQAALEHGMSWRSFQDEKECGASIANDWHIAGWPTYYLLDVEGIIARRWQGWPSPTELNEAIRGSIDSNEEPSTPFHEREGIITP